LKKLFDCLQECYRFWLYEVDEGDEDVSDIVEVTDVDGNYDRSADGCVGRNDDDLFLSIVEEVIIDEVID